MLNTFLAEATPIPSDNNVNFRKKKRIKMQFTCNDEELKLKTEIYIKKCRQGEIRPHLTDWDKNLYILEHRNRSELDG